MSALTLGVQGQIRSAPLSQGPSTNAQQTSSLASRFCAGIKSAVAKLSCSGCSCRCLCVLFSSQARGPSADRQVRSDGEALYQRAVCVSPQSRFGRDAEAGNCVRQVLLAHHGLQADFSPKDAAEEAEEWGGVVSEKVAMKLQQWVRHVEFDSSDPFAKPWPSPLPLKDYLKKLKFMGTPNILVYACILLERLMNHEDPALKIVITQWNVHNLILASLSVSMCMLEDRCRERRINSAREGGCSSLELFRHEREFLVRLQFDVLIDPRELVQYREWELGIEDNSLQVSSCSEKIRQELFDE